MAKPRFDWTAPSGEFGLTKGQLAADMLHDGRTQKEVAAKVGCSLGTLRRQFPSEDDEPDEDEQPRGPLPTPGTIPSTARPRPAPPPPAEDPAPSLVDAGLTTAALEEMLPHVLRAFVCVNGLESRAKSFSLAWAARERYRQATGR